MIATYVKDKCLNVEIMCHELVEEDVHEAWAQRNSTLEECTNWT